MLYILNLISLLANVRAARIEKKFSVYLLKKMWVGSRRGGPVLRSCNPSAVFDLRVTLSGLVFERVSGLLCE
jgi:hypothetical protein